MTTEDIFMQVDSRMTEALMFHEKLAIYFKFIGRDDLAEMHIDKFLEESESLAELNMFYLDTYDKLIPQSEVGRPAVIPDSWYRYMRSNLTEDDKINAVNIGLTKWKEWEQDTRSMYSNMCARLMDNGDIEAADMLIMKARDAAKEMRCAIRLMK